MLMPILAVVAVDVVEVVEIAVIHKPISQVLVVLDWF
tara:strand:- start:68 stop:178 length:111 start_codon:yes stop_codon:yes gene_type:complete